MTETKESSPRKRLFDELAKRFAGSPEIFFNAIQMSGFPVANLNRNTATQLFGSFIDECGKQGQNSLLAAFRALSEVCPSSKLLEAISERLGQVGMLNDFWTEIVATIGAAPDATTKKKTASAGQPKEGATVTWLHITDLHCGLDNSGCLWDLVKDSFYNDLKKVVEKRCGGIDIVFFTGDHVQAGTKDQYVKLEKELSELWAFLKALVPEKTPILIPVPGNHDLERPDLTTAQAIVADIENPALAGTFWSAASHPHRQAIADAFKNYSQWTAALPFRTLPNTHAGLLPGEFAATVPVNGFNIGIMGLNTAFMQLTPGDYSGRLLVNGSQVTILQPRPGEWERKHDLRFLLSHHPPECMSAPALKTLEMDIAPAGRFHLHLFGHLHENRAIGQAVGGANPRRHWQSASLFGLKKFVGGTTGELDRQHGYMIGKFELGADGVGGLTMWPRAMTSIEHVGYKVGPDSAKFVLNEDTEATSASPELFRL